MRRRWEDLNARARGLSTHLLPDPELERLAGAADLELLARSLPPSLRPPEGVPATARRLDRAAARAGGKRLELLARWAGPSRRRRLSAVFGETDRRCVRMLLRGAAAGLPPERKLDGVLPTPALPEPVLADAARADEPADVLAALVEAGHPFAGALLHVTARGRHGTTDLFALETALSRVWARHAVQGAGRDRGLRRFVARSVDLENAWTALLSPGSLAEPAPAADAEPVPGEGGPDGERGDLFLEGGATLDRAAFRAVLKTSDRGRRRQLLAEALAGTPLAGPFGDPGVSPADLEARALDARVAEERRAARTDPLGPAPLLEYVLRLRRQVARLRRAVWGLEMEAPAALRAGGGGPA